MTNFTTFPARTENCAHVWLKSKRLGVRVPADDLFLMEERVHMLAALDADIMLLNEELGMYARFKRSTKDPALRSFYDNRYREQHAVLLSNFGKLDAMIQNGVVGISLLNRDEIESGKWQMYLFQPVQRTPLHTVRQSSPKSR